MTTSIDAFDMRQSKRRIGRVRLKLRDLEAGAAFTKTPLVSGGFLPRPGVWCSALPKPRCCN